MIIKEKGYLQDGSPAKIYRTSGKGNSNCYACSIVAISSESTSCLIHGFRLNVDYCYEIDNEKMD